MSLGLLLITLLSYYSMGQIKNQIDTIHQENIAPAAMLAALNRHYIDGILIPLHRYQNRLIDASEGFEKLKNAHGLIEESWLDYESYNHPPQKQQAIISLGERIKENLETVNLLYHLLEANGRSAVNEIVQKEFYRSTPELLAQINTLIDLEFEQAAIHRDESTAILEATKNILFFSLLILFSLAAGIFYPIMKSIQRNDSTLRSLNDKLTEISITDSLTGVYNRRYFEMLFPKEVQTNRRRQDTLAFAMIDIDYFKRYNDTYGHQQGDEALKKVAAAMRDHLKRSEDYVFRLGGEEFVVFISHISEESAKLFFEKLKQSIQDLHIDHSGNTHPYLTVSIGVTFVPQLREESPDAIIRCADMALYEAKNSGRNKVVFHPFDAANCLDPNLPTQSGLSISHDSDS